MSNKSEQIKKSRISRIRNLSLDNTKSHSCNNNNELAPNNSNDSNSASDYFGVSWYSGAIISGLVSMTLFLSGDLNERSGIVHFPAILWLIFAVGLTSAPIIFKRKAMRLVFRPIDIAVYLFFFYVFLSTIWNLFNGGAPRPTFNMFSVWILCLSAWFVFRQLLHDIKVVAVIFGIVIAVASTESVLAIYQQFVEIPTIKQLIKEDPIKLVKQADPTLEPGTPAWDMVYSRLITALPVGTYSISNTLGGFLGCCLIFILGIYTLGQSIHKSDNNPITFFKLFAHKFSETRAGLSRGKSDLISLRRRILMCFRYDYLHHIVFGIFTLMLFVGFVLAKSRSGFVAVGLGFVLLAFLLVKRRLGKTVKRFLFIVTIILIAAIAAVSMTSGKDLISGAKKSFGFRLEYWTATLGMIRDYPVLGCGTGNFKHTYTRYKLPISSEEISDPHNFVFEIASNCGIPSVLIFVLAVGLICCRIRDKTTEITNKTIETVDKKIQNELNQHQQQLGWTFPYFIGGLIGCYFAFFLSLYSESPLGFDSLLASTVVFLLFGFIDIGKFERIPSALILVVIIVLFVHISASSGISMTNMAILIWLFLSILANRQTTLEEGKLQLKLRYVISVTFIILVLFVNFFGFRQVVNSNNILYRLELAGDIDEQVLVLLDAVNADPYSAMIQDRLARMAMLCHLRDPSNTKWYAIVESAQAKAMKLAPRSGMIRYSCADMRAEAGRRLKDIKLAESSIDIYREAVKYYPNNATIHTALAIILYQLGKKSESRIHAEIAINLDDQMKHIELKIKPDKREALLYYIEDTKKSQENENKIKS
ncbi:MAG: O-antigen ligase family protein [Planctomycetaceae bacterium]|jgi:hypothetical protein|nr:O-antigen ligase family protein [Planctomycetaceae bacterium]